MKVVLLLGAPGTGKSTLGRHIARTHADECDFVSAGEWIREQGLLEASNEHLRSEAKELLNRALLSPKDILVLEFVKDINDAFALMQILSTKTNTLAQVILLTRHTTRAIRSLLLPSDDAPRSRQRDLERKVAERTPKWDANVGRLIEFFSSMGVLHALVGSRRPFFPLHPLLAATTAASTGAIDRLLPRGLLSLQRLDWVVSPRLVTDEALVERLAHEAAHSIAGLRSLLQMPVPFAVVRTEEDVRWVTSVPGRYKVSHKCDGTRYMLIVAEDGRHYFRNRVGFVYAFPVSNPLPSRTILDGELVWGQTDGCFLAFDAVVFAGRRVWGLSLSERLEAMTTSLATDAELAPPLTNRLSLHRQRAPSADAKVAVVVKRHFDSLADASTPSYLTDGMVFTPDAMPYVLPHHGLLTYKWQPEDRRACDLRSGGLGLVYECVHCPWTGWQPVAIRWDKAFPSACCPNECIGARCVDVSLLEGPAHLSCRRLQTVPCFTGISRKTPSKASLLRCEVERTVDQGTGLEIFNRRPDQKALPCRGTVYDGDRLVAAAFDSFDCKSPRRIARNHCFNASLKFDGTLIIAFVHDGAVRACTRRRMDSEQAIWARKWIAEHANVEAFIEGWTYAFEAIYAANTVVVQYAFEGLVFLDAWSPDGMSTPPSDRPALSSRLGALMCAPSLACHASELWRLLEGPALAFEGWVLEDGVRRFKFVHPSYKSASRLASEALHPVCVWQAIRMGGGGGAAKTMPAHFREERMAMLSALELAFEEERRALLGGIPSVPMYYDRSSSLGMLRVQLMDLIRPTDAGEMRYYVPSDNFAQTFAKGWKKGPVVPAVPLIVSVLGSTGVMDHIFEKLPMPSLARALLVCKGWSHAITQDAGYSAKVADYVARDRKAEMLSSRLIRMVIVTGSSDDSDDERAVFLVRSDDEGYGSR